MEKKRIVVIMQSMNIGGVEKAMVSLLSVIPEDRYDVNLVLSKKVGEFLNKIPAYVHIVEAPYHDGIAPGEGILEILGNLKARGHFTTWLKVALTVMINKLLHKDRLLARLLYQDSTQQYDYLFNFAGVNNLTHLLSKYVYRADNRYIWVHGDSDAAGFSDYMSVYSAYDRVFCVSEAVTNKFRKFISQMSLKADTIYNVIDKKSIIRQSDVEEGLIRENDETILLTVGRLDVCKGYNIAIDACHKLVNDGCNVKWYVVGEGTERENLEAQIIQKGLKDCFILLGLKSNPYPFYKTTDIYVQTSISEGYCITLAEAKIFHKPIVTTNFSGADEQIIDGENGYIVSANADVIAESIKLLINDEIVREKFKNRSCSENISSSFDKLEQLMIADMNKKISGG